MSDIQLSTETMKYIRMATQMIHVDILDCVQENDLLVFVVRKGQLGAAIGKKAKNLERLRNVFKKTIKFVEKDDDRSRFIQNLCKPYKVESVTLSGEDTAPVAQVSVSASEKSRLIGKGGRNIELIRKLARRHHNIRDVQVK
jgi:transcription termination/antitermination protein NusA